MSQVNKPHLKIRCIHINFTYGTYKVLGLNTQFSSFGLKLEYIHRSRMYVKIHYPTANITT